MTTLQVGAEEGAGTRGLSGVEATAKAGAISIKDRTGIHRRQLPHPLAFNKVSLSFASSSSTILSSFWGVYLMLMRSPEKGEVCMTQLLF